jgi:exopolyphosphatase/guanosine-5'-triphosphate,3'-diphosphate pyrophosphatase
VKCLHAHLAWWLAGGDDPVGRWVEHRLGLDTRPSSGEPFRMRRRTRTVAALDCGTNSTRLLVADAEGAVLERRMQVTRLGEGVDAHHRLSAAAIGRTITVLREYRLSMDAHGVTTARLVATSAVRDAENSAEFMAAATEVIGVEPEVLSGEEEGRLSFSGATAHLPRGLGASDAVLVVDIGGGSTELSLGPPRAAESGSVAVTSLDVGCVRLTERFFRHDPPRPEEVTEARRCVEMMVHAAGPPFSDLPAGGVLVGLAGTVSTLACLDQGLAAYERERIHHSTLDIEAVDRWLDILSRESALDRAARPGMVEGRQDIVVGGILILLVVMREFGCTTCLVSEDDILDGMVRSLLD